jgi:hypothetical protein
MRVCLAVLITCVGIALSNSARARLLDQSFEASFYYPYASTPYRFAAFAPQTFTVNSGLETTGEVEGVTSLLTDFSAESLTITFNTVLHCPIWAIADFNGLVFRLQSAGDLGLATAAIDAGSTLAEFGTSRISFTDTEIALDWSGLSYVDGQQLILNFTFNDAPLPLATVTIPELGPLAMLMIGIVVGWTFLQRNSGALSTPPYTFRRVPSPDYPMRYVHVKLNFAFDFN